MTIDRELVSAWRDAAADLRIAIHVPYIMRDETFPLHVPAFGSPSGALPLWIGDTRSRNEAEANGYFVSLLNPVVYCKYDRANFVEMLVDWGWFGEPNEAPQWYKDEAARITG